MLGYVPQELPAPRIASESVSSQTIFFADDRDQGQMLAAAEAAGAVALPMIRRDDEEEATAVPPTEASRVAMHRTAYLLPKEHVDLVPILHDRPIEGADAESIDPWDSPVIELALSGEQDGRVLRGRLYVCDHEGGTPPAVRRLYNRLARVVRGWPPIPSFKGAFVGPGTERRVRAGELTLDDDGTPFSLDED